MDGRFQIDIDRERASVPISVVPSNRLPEWRSEATEAAQRWTVATGFRGDPGQVSLIPDSAGGIAEVLVGASPEGPDIWRLADLPRTLPQGVYRLAGGADPTDAALGWALGAYRFERYKPGDRKPEERPLLRLPEGVEAEAVERTAFSLFLARDLINTPAEDMGPSGLQKAIEDMSARHGATVTTTAGDDLLTENYPAIHAVGRAAKEAPRLMELHWGDGPKKVALVGKGVTFDTGGLDLKSAAGMKTMKKDMGGAATVIGLADLLMASGADITLTLLVPAVENAIGPGAFRPLDIVPTRLGKTIEVGNTDAEGRVILADALTRATELSPETIIDFATLTGAARVALGPELPALFSNDDALAAAILDAGSAADDPLWRMPLWPGYRKWLEVDHADVTNAPDRPFGGAITAALFLETFLGSAKVAWAHIDTYGWNGDSRPGRPKGGEGLGIRALYRALTAGTA